MTYGVERQQLIDLDVELRTDRPHVVVLGAGASLAAFPNGEATGKRLPAMPNIAQILELEDLIKAAGFDPKADFESLYSMLYSLNPQSRLLKVIEESVVNYFSSLEMPPQPTLYDVLILTLREKDAIFTFNWDPFLVDAYRRNYGKASLPQIFHLHGNVRVAFCPTCRLSMPKASKCQRCATPLSSSRLLYPVEKKNYAGDAFISTQWDQARDYIGRALLVTIFGYRAPETDAEAMSIFTKAWKVENPETKPVERVEVIDIRDPKELAAQWCPFAHFSDHINIRSNFYDSFLSMFPRRSCEALAHQGWNGDFVESIPQVRTPAAVLNVVPSLVRAEQLKVASN